MENGLVEPSEKLIADWFRRVRESQFIHYACANYFNRLHSYLGIPTPADVGGSDRFSFNETGVWFGAGFNASQAFVSRI